MGVCDFNGSRLHATQPGAYKLRAVIASVENGEVITIKSAEFRAGDPRKS